MNIKEILEKADGVTHRGWPASMDLVGDLAEAIRSLQKKVKKPAWLSDDTRLGSVPFKPSDIVEVKINGVVKWDNPLPFKGQVLLLRDDSKK